MIRSTTHRFSRRRANIIGSAADSIVTVEPLESRTLLTSYTLTSIPFTPGDSGEEAPLSNIVIDSGGNLYGATGGGGADFGGAVFEVAHGSTTITTLASFTAETGGTPYGNLVIDTAGNLYGTTSGGNLGGYGTVFEVAHGTAAITVLGSFNMSNGADPLAGLAMDSSGDVFGTTSSGGLNDAGTVFEVAHGSSQITTIANFDLSNGGTDSPVVVDAAGDLFGTFGGGSTGSNYGIWEIHAGTSVITPLATVGAGGLVLDSSGDLFGTAVPGIGTVFEIAHGTSAVTTLATFDGADGMGGVTAFGTLTIDAAGDLFGGSWEGGQATSTSNGNDGTVFEVAHGTSSITALAVFNGADGMEPNGVTLDGNGNLFGTTYEGGDLSASSDGFGDGTVFELSPSTTSGGPTAAKLAFAQQPSNMVVGATMAPAVTVDVDSSSGQIVTTDNSDVTLAIGSGPAGGSLGGTLTEQAVNGIVTFSNLSIAAAGENYILTASDGALTPATSTAFDVTATALQPSLVPTFGSVNLAASVVAGAKLKARVPVVITNEGSDIKGDVTVNLYADTGTSLDGNEVLLGSATNRISLKTGKSHSFAFSIKSLPSTLADGTYHLLAEVINPTGATSVAATTQTVVVAAATVTLEIDSAVFKPNDFDIHSLPYTFTVTVTNSGNVAAVGTLIIRDEAYDDQYPLGSVAPVSDSFRAKINAGKSERFVIHRRYQGQGTLPQGTFGSSIEVSLDGASADTLVPDAYTVT